jgi:ABC-type proline/glycine betaine transport system permease subunit
MRKCCNAVLGWLALIMYNWFNALDRKIEGIVNNAENVLTAQTITMKLLGWMALMVVVRNVSLRLIAVYAFYKKFCDEKEC